MRSVVCAFWKKNTKATRYNTWGESFQEAGGVSLYSGWEHRAQVLTCTEKKIKEDKHREEDKNTQPSRQEDCTMKQVQHAQDIFSLSGFTEPNIGRPG